LLPLNFEYTNINLLGFTVFEPITILTNLIIIVYGVFVYNRLIGGDNSWLKTWAWFFLLMSVSAFFGSISHGVHEQLGSKFLNVTWFLMNAFSLLSIYFFFKAAYKNLNTHKVNNKKWLDKIVVIWIVTLLIATYLMNDFLLIKIHAGIVLLYSLIAHYVTLKNQKQKGSLMIISGIGLAFVSIIIHSLKLSIGEWMNYKDISHLFMFLSMFVIYKGVNHINKTESFIENIAN
jgi:hypothetical protein